MNLFSKRMIRLLSLTTATMVMLNVVGCNMAGPKTPSPGTKQQATPKTQSVPNAPRALTAAKKLTPVIGELPNKPPKQRVELKSKRSKFSTRYLNPNGTFTEEIYNVPQYYLDSTDKTFKPIDNTLKVRGNNKHENTAGDLHVVLADTVSSDELVSAEFAGTSVALVPVNGKSGVKGTVKGNSITYPNLFPNADVKYDVQGNVLKESIVLTSSAAANTYSFELRTNGLTASTDAKGKIVLTNAKKKQVYSFAKPYMVDATGRSSSKVTYALRTAAGHTYIDVTADSAFLKDPATKYPVVVDPTLNTWDTLQDTFVSSTQPSVAFGSGTTLYTGNDPTYGTTRSLVQFFLPSLPSDAKISTATISLYQTKSSATNTAIDMYRATSAWSNSTTWSNQPTIGTTADGTTTNNATNAYWTWTITNLAKDWYNGVSPNYGVELRQQSEATTASRVFNQLGAITNTPRLSITYTVDPMGMESYWGTTKDLVNPANGNLMLQETDLNVPGRGEPMAVARTYNSRKATAAGLFGYGWWSNLDSRLVDSGSGPITLIDDDGTRHIFGQKIGGGYEEPGGAGLVLVKNPDNTYTLTQPDNTASTYNTAGRLATSTDANGNVMKYTYDTNGRLTTITDPSGRTSAVTYGTNGYVATITDPATHVWKYEYDASNNLSRVLDPASNPMSFTYDTAHKMLTFTDRKGTVTTFVYDTSDRVSTISRPLTSGGTTSSGTTTMTYDTTNLVTTETDYEGKRTDYSYNANGNLTQITQNPTDAANKSVITYAYDNNNRLTQTKDPLSVNSNGTGYVYNYDANGNITSAQLPDNQVATYTYDAKNNMATATDFNNNVNQFAYDARNNQTEAVDPRAQAISSRYTSNGTLSYTAQPMAAADNYVSNSSFELDTNSDNWPDHWVQATETGKTATFAWSTTSRFGGKSVTITNPTGWAIISNDVYVPYTAGDVYAVSGYLKTSNTTGTALVKMEYLDASDNFLGQQISNPIKGTNDWTRLQSVLGTVPANTTKIRVSVGMNAGTGSATFDGVQLEKASVLSAYNLVENGGFERDLNGDKVPDSWTASSNLSANDGVLQETNPSDDTAYTGTASYKLTGEQGKNKYVNQRINLAGDANTLLTLSGWSKQTGADPNGGNYQMQVALNYTDGTVDWTNANDFDKSTTGWQHVAAQVTPKKAFSSVDVYYYYYNQLGTAYFDATRLELGDEVTNYTYDANGNYLLNTVDQANISTSNTYDAVGNRTSYTDGRGMKTSYTYDPRNLLTKVTDPANGVVTFGYDAAGNRTSVVDQNTNSTAYDYNEYSMLSKITDPLNKATTFDYDHNGKLTQTTYPNGNKVTNTYDAQRRLSTISYNGTQQYAFSYDPNGDVTAITDASGRNIANTFDKNSRLISEAIGANRADYTFDPNNNLTSLKVTAGSTSVTTDYVYNPLNQVTVINRNGSFQAKYVYDERGNTISVIRPNSTYTAYEYDTSNRVTAMRNYDANGVLIDSYAYGYDNSQNRTSVTTTAGNYAYQYDNLNRLTQETLPDGTVVTYKYDAAGNRTQQTVTKGGTATTTTYTYDAANQLKSVNGQAYTYDANGNVTATGTRTMKYDAENRLTEVLDTAGNSLAKFTYDNNGRRTSKTTSTGTINFVYKDTNVVADVDANNNIVNEYAWDSSGRPVSMTKNNYSYFYHLNGHGDVTSLTDATGAVVASYTYDAWGNLVSSSGAMAAANPYRYAGYRYDAETGLYYLMARYYDPAVGRFITRDTNLGNTTDPDSLNLYVYVKNNPLTLVDPSGHAYRNYHANGYEWYTTSYYYGWGAWLPAYAVKWAISSLISIVVTPLKFIPKVGKLFASVAGFVLGEQIKSIPPRGSTVHLDYRRKHYTTVWYGRNYVIGPNHKTFDDSGWFRVGSH